MNRTPFTREELRAGVEQYQTYTQGLSARTYDVDSFWEEESKMLSEFPGLFQTAGCIPERKHLKGLTKWKWAGLWANHAHKNSRAGLRDTTRRAFGITDGEESPSAKAIRRQLALLDEGLVGISAATATVLLTFWRPDAYTVMDQRALACLAAADFWGGDSEANIEEYPEYLKRCHLISEETGLSLRDVDRGLWSMGD